MSHIKSLKLSFSNNAKKLKFSHHTIHLIFYDSKNILCSTPKWFDNELTSILSNKNFVKNTDSLSVFKYNYNSFLIIKDFSFVKDDNSLFQLEKLGGKTFNLIKNLNYNDINIYLDDDMLLPSFIYGMYLNSYNFENYKSTKKNNIKSLNIKSDNFKKINNEFKSYEHLISGIFLTRNLVWKPANILFPKSFVQECQKLSKQGLKITVYNELQLKKMNMEALLAVGRGSKQSSYVVCLEWKGGEKKEKPLAILGKGVCFDSGGLSLKPAKSMEDMKWDMGGAGVTVGLMEAVSKAKLRKNVIGVIGLVENMPGGNAQRPGDVIKSFSGKTIEVLNTDAEGRLVLADLISWSEKKYKPAFIIDLATLTGAMIVSLGNVRAGLFANNENLSDKIFNSGEKTGDKVWKMPIDEDYNSLLDTEIADMKNIGGPGAGSITAACFLKRHVNDTPWAHMDIAGVTWNNKSNSLNPRGATGWGVKLLFDLIKNFDYKI